MKKIFLAVATALAMFSCSQKEPVTVTITNPLSIDRNGEMVEISMAEITGKLQLPDTAQVIVLDENGLEVPYQITYDDMLIFPASVKGDASAVYTIAEGTPQPVDVVACGRQYPERLDDVAWENDRAAYRAYGPALQEKGERAFGYDIWTKSVSEPVVEDRYDGDLNRGISYHVDHGNGMDCYAVGPTLGGGTAALFPDSTIVYKNIDGTYFFCNSGNHSLYGRFVSNIAYISVCLDSFFSVRSQTFIHQFLIDVVETDGCALFCKSRCNSKTDTIRSACYKSYFTFQRKIQILIHDTYIIKLMKLYDLFQVCNQ